MAKVLIFIVAYNAENFIAAVLERIPAHIWNNLNYEIEVLIIDDQSSDRTFDRAVQYARASGKPNITVLYNPSNLKYGGNQKIGYHYAIQKGFDAVVLLHGDGQYPPEYLDKMIDPLLSGEADVVLASRMIDKLSALKGKMPLYKWFGNQALTTLQNTILHSNLAEFHTGYRSYSVKALRLVPFSYNSDYYDFDTDILIQMIDTHKRIKEIPIPTSYGDEISRVNSFKYGLLILYASILSRVTRLSIFYDPRFDYTAEEAVYQPKFGFNSSHEFGLQRVKPGDRVVDIASGTGYMVRALAEKGAHCVAVDRHLHPDVIANADQTIEADVESFDFNVETGKIDVILALDIIEHLRSPEAFLTRLRQRFSQDRPMLVLTTGNIGFFITRMALLFNQFNYGRRGILDFDHKRLFTFSTLRRLLAHHGYDVLEVKGIPAPFPLALGNTRLARFLLAVNTFLIKLSKSLFSYQIAVTARPRPTLSHLLSNAQETGRQKAESVE